MAYVRRSRAASDGSHRAVFFYSMNNQLIEEASKIVPDTKFLINIISRRVRQLSAGSRSMVEIEPRMDYADIALAEVIQGKLSANVTYVDPHSVAE